MRNYRDKTGLGKINKDDGGMKILSTEPDHEKPDGVKS